MRRDNPAAQYADNIAEDRKNRDGYHASYHARDNQIIDGADCHNFKRVDLFGDFHCRNFRSDSRAHAPRADYADQNRCHVHYRYFYFERAVDFYNL